ncbi:MAG: glycosyltransferase family 4 protein, partial [bacterium]
FVMPSRYEGYGLTLAEAMAHGVPILASTADSLPELLAGYAGGRCLAGDAWTGASLAEAARLAHGEPRWSHTADEMCAAYAALYASKKPKQRSNIEC